MRDGRRFAILRGMIDLRHLQVRAAEMKALRAQIDAQDEARRTRDTAAILAADTDHWERLHAAGQFDPDAAMRWASAVRQDLEHLLAGEAACDAARAHETAARNAWYQASDREKAAEERLDAACRADRKRTEETSLHRVSEHHLAARGRRP